MTTPRTLADRIDAYLSTAPVSPIRVAHPLDREDVQPIEPRVFHVGFLPREWVIDDGDRVWIAPAHSMGWQDRRAVGDRSLLLRCEPVTRAAEVLAAIGYTR